MQRFAAVADSLFLFFICLTRENCKNPFFYFWSGNISSTTEMYIIWGLLCDFCVYLFINWYDSHGKT